MLSDKGFSLTFSTLPLGALAGTVHTAPSWNRLRGYVRSDQRECSVRGPYSPFTTPRGSSCSGINSYSGQLAAARCALFAALIFVLPFLLPVALPVLLPLVLAFLHCPLCCPLSCPFFIARLLSPALARNKGVPFRELRCSTAAPSFAPEQAELGSMKSLLLCYLKAAVGSAFMAPESSELEKAGRCFAQRNKASEEKVASQPFACLRKS